MPDPSYLFGPSRARRPNVMARRHVVVSGPLLRLARRTADPGGRRQCDRRRRGDRARDRRAGERVRRLRRCRAGDDPPRRTRRDACDQRRRCLAEGGRHRAFPSELRRPHSRGLAADSGSRRAEPSGSRRWRASAPCRSARSRRPRSASRATGFPTYPFLAETARRQAGEIRAMADHGRHLPAERAAAARWARSSCRPISRRTLQYMADQERAHAQGDRLAGLKAARDAFYRGDIASAIVRHQRENGGWLAGRGSRRIP